MSYQKELSLPFSKLSKLIKIAYPNEKSSRKPVKIISKEVYSLNDYWDEGSRNFCVFMDMNTMEILPSTDMPKAMFRQEYNGYKLPIAEIKLLSNHLAVEMSYFQGKFMGYAIYCSPDFFEYLENRIKNNPEENLLFQLPNSKE